MAIKMTKMMKVSLLTLGVMVSALILSLKGTDANDDLASLRFATTDDTVLCEKNYLLGETVALDKAVVPAGGMYSFKATEDSYKVEAEMTQNNVANSWEVDNDISDFDYYTAEDYLNDPSLFVPVWSGTWNPPAELLDFEQKWEAFFTPNGRLMSMAHRADNNIYYPENSIEGILSCIATGVDMIEIDIATTKDGVHVLMHDDTLTRTTNVSQLRAAGVTGLPATNRVSDWTFEQLRLLRLVRELPNGGKEVTNYVIPTYEDVVMVCADKIFVYMDIKDRETFDWEQDAYPIVKKYNAYRSVWLPFDYSRWVSAEKLNELLTTIKSDSGYNKVAFQCSTSPDNVEDVVQMISTYNLPLALRAGTYSATTYDSAFAPYFGNYRIHVNTIFTDYENLASWQSIYAKGYNSIQVDDYMTLVKYIAETIQDN